MTGLKISYARVSTVGQDLTAQRDGLAALGVDAERVYVDHGLTGTSRSQPGLREALAACRAGDTLVVTKLVIFAAKRRHLCDRSLSHRIASDASGSSARQLVILAAALLATSSIVAAATGAVAVSIVLVIAGLFFSPVMIVAYVAAHTAGGEHRQNFATTWVNTSHNLGASSWQCLGRDTHSNKRRTRRHLLHRGSRAVAAPRQRRTWMDKG